MNSDTFDGSRPILVSYDTIRDIEDRINVPFDGDENRVLDGLGHFYNEYILPNMFPIIVISILCIYLLIKYILKQDREEREELDKKERDEEKARNRRARRIYRSMANDDRDTSDEDEGDRRGTTPVRSHHQKIPPPTDGVNVSSSNSSLGSSDVNDIDDDSDQNIADYISDDYLLTDTDDQSQSSNFDASNPRHPDNPMYPNNPMNPNAMMPQISEANPMMSDMIAIHRGGLSTPFSTQADEMYKSRDRVSKMIFGQ